MFIVSEIPDGELETAYSKVSKPDLVSIVCYKERELRKLRAAAQKVKESRPTVRAKRPAQQAKHKITSRPIRQCNMCYSKNCKRRAKGSVCIYGYPA
jgi:hypothetical protein